MKGIADLAIVDSLGQLTFEIDRDRIVRYSLAGDDTAPMV